MKKSILVSLPLFFLLVLSCSRDQNRGDTHYIQLKHLEFERNADTDSWLKLYNKADEKVQLEIIRSIAKTKAPELLPVLQSLLSAANRPELISELFFALGQLDNAAGEKSLLSREFESLSMVHKKDLILALGHCGTKQSVGFITSVLDNPDLAPVALHAAALLARRKINVRPVYQTVTDTSSVYPLSKELAYFLANDKSDLKLEAIIPRLYIRDSDTKKYLYKAINNAFLAPGSRRIFSADSAQIALLRSDIRSTLNESNPWQLKYQALSILPLVGDSTFAPALERLAGQGNVHLQIAAINSYNHLLGEKGLGFLLSMLQSSTDLYKKGQLIIEIAKTSPQRAFPFINNHLDRGDVFYVKSLLKALSFIKNPLAVDKIRQYLLIPEPALNNEAFHLLKNLGKLRRSDVNSLLDKEAPAIVSLALEWKREKNYRTDLEQLVNIFHRFDIQNAFDVQLEVAKTLVHFNHPLTADQSKQITDNASHAKILQTLAANYNAIDSVKLNPMRYVPPALKVDSIVTSAYKMAKIVTNKGEITIDFNHAVAPLTVNNFIRLAERGFYNGLLFHRVVSDFVIQGGDPSGDGYGGPGYMIPSEDNHLPFKRGSVGMATSGFDTGGSQFFICHSEQPHLNGRYTHFGHVKTGLEIIDKIVPGDQIKEIVLMD